MITQHLNHLQQAVDEIGGFENDPLRCNGKTGKWSINGVEADVDMQVVIIVPTAKHCGIRFNADGRDVEKTPVLR
jgi:hypothetical protein